MGSVDGGPGLGILAGVASSLFSDGALADSVHAGHWDGMAQRAGSPSKNLFRVGWGLLRAFPRPRPHFLPSGSHGVSVGLADEGMSRPNGFPSHRRESELDSSVPIPAITCNYSSSNTHRAVGRAGYSVAVGFRGGRARQADRHGLAGRVAFDQGRAIHLIRILLNLGRRVESLVVWGTCVRVSFLKRGNPLYRKAGIPAWKVWSDGGFGSTWCVLVDRPDIWSAGFVPS